MSIPPAFLDELRARIALSDIVGRRLKLQRAGREWKAPCPFHAEKTPSFYINDQKSFFHCFGCGAHGDAVGFLMRHDGLAFPDAVEQLAAQAGMEMPRPEPAEQRKYDRLKRLADTIEAAAKWFEAELRGAAGHQAMAYLKGRGLDDRAIAEFRLGYAPLASEALRAALTQRGCVEADLEEAGLIRRPDDGRTPYSFFRNRVIFPVADKRGRVIAFGGRILEGEGPKYVNSPEHALFHKGTVLYGLARARAAFAKGERPVVVEGYMDVIAMQQAGFGGAVAPLGTALSEAQLGELWKAQSDKGGAQNPPILCFDGDAAGRRAAFRAVERVLPILSPAHTVAVAFLPQGDDPDSLIRRGGVAAMREVLDAALPLVDVVWEFTVAGRPAATPEQKAGLRADLMAQAGAIADRSVQFLYRDELLRRFDALFPPFLRRGKRDPRLPAAPLGPKPQRKPRDPALEARVLLAAMINHSFLFAEWGETFAEMDLPPPWRPLRQAVFEALLDEALDARSLADHLRTAGHDAELEEILGSATTRHAKFVAPDAPEETVKAGWLDVWKRYHHRILGQEVAAARAELDRDFSQSVERINALTMRREVEGSGDQEKASHPVDEDEAASDRRHWAEVLDRNPLKSVRQDEFTDSVRGRVDSLVQKY